MLTLSCLKGAHMRFFDVDGIEMDIQEPKFFIDEEQMITLRDAIEEMLSVYF
jgi:hypothetical protein